jgi:hypothetical protein
VASPLKEGSLWPASLALSAPAYLLPIFNPDLFWHLSSGRWILRHGAVPRADFLSFTMEGAPWSDFEWLSQLIFQGIYSLGGMPALWALKAVLLALSARLFLRTLALYSLPELHRGAALVLWSLAALAGSDIRPELFSRIIFSALVLGLEAHRLGRLTLRPAAFFAVFALWANFHAGFPFGLLLLACYAAAAAAARTAWRPLLLCAAAAAGGALCTPYGLGPYLVSFQHWQSRSDMAAHIQEWHPMAFGNFFHWPFWLILALFVPALARGWGRARRSAPWGLALAGLILGFNSLLHARLAAYFTAVALPLVFSLTGEVPVTRALKRAAAAAAVIVTAFFVWTLPARSWGGFFDSRYIPQRAAAFLEASRPQVEGLRLYNEWEWGGYLAWRFSWYKVFWDGRYLFHDRLAQAGAASREGASAWQKWMEKQELQGALMHNRAELFPTTKLYKDKTTKGFLRPWYLQYMPRQLWALVYWDEKTLFFMRRDAAPADWLAAHEYRYFLPRDEAAFAEALRLGEIPAAALAAEKLRHQAALAAGL